MADRHEALDLSGNEERGMVARNLAGLLTWANHSMPGAYGKRWSSDRNGGRLQPETASPWPTTPGVAHTLQVDTRLAAEQLRGGPLVQSSAGLRYPGDTGLCQSVWHHILVGNRAPAGDWSPGLFSQTGITEQIISHGDGPMAEVRITTPLRPIADVIDLDESIRRIRELAVGDRVGYYALHELDWVRAIGAIPPHSLLNPNPEVG